MLAYVVALIMACMVIPYETAFAAEETYGFQGLTGTVMVPGKGPRETNNIKLTEPANITVDHTTSEPGGYFLNTINETLDGTENIQFAFCMTAGMNNLWEDGIKRDDGVNPELKFVTRNLDPNPAAAPGREEELKDKLTQVNIYSLTNGEEYNGAWLGTRTAIANYQKGNLKVDYDKCHANVTGNDRSGRITLYIPADTLPSGEYIFEFGPNTCGNEPLKAPLVPIAFKFKVKGAYTFELALSEAEAKLASANPGTEPGDYAAEAIEALRTKVQEAKNLGDNPGADEKAAMAAALGEAIETLEKSRVVHITAGEIQGITPELSVGDANTATIEVSADPNDNGAYTKKKWRIKQDGDITAKNQVVTIDPDTGEYTANRPGTATIQAISKWNNTVLKEFPVTVTDEGAMFSVNIPKGSSLKDITEATGRDTSTLAELKVYTSKGVNLTAADFAFLRSLPLLKKLDLAKAACPVIPSDQQSGGALSGCENIEELILPEDLTKIGTQAFQNCTKLTTLEIPAAVTFIGGQAFKNCGNLKTLHMRAVSPPKHSETPYSFEGASVEKIRVPYGCGNAYGADPIWNQFTLLPDTENNQLNVRVSKSGELAKAAESALGEQIESNIDTLVIVTDDQVSLSASKDIPYLQKNFINATTIDLSAANLPDKKLSGTVFSGRINASVKTLRLNDNVTTIGQNALKGFYNLQDIILPASLNNLSQGTFGECEKLKSELVINARKPPITNGSPFIPGTVTTIVVPPGCRQAYESHPFWTTFKIIPQVDISLSTPTLTLEVAQSQTLTARVTVYSNNDKTVKWSSSNDRVAAVNRDTGTVTAIKPGTAVITATTLEGGVTASCVVTVKAVAPPAWVKTSATYNSVKLTWPTVGGAAGYEIYRATKANGSYSKLRTLSASARSYTDTGRTTGTAYYYKVRAYKIIGGTRYLGDYSGIAGARPSLAKVTKVKAKKGGAKKIKISWKRVNGASGYTVYRSTKKTKGYKSIKTVKSSKTIKYTNSKLKKGKRYYYKVRAYRKIGKKKVYGPYSGIVWYKAR